jgi:CheY-like chemotaxis protein
MPLLPPRPPSSSLLPPPPRYARQLELAGYTVRTAATGEEGLCLLHADASVFDFLLLDIISPNDTMDGITFLGQVKSNANPEIAAVPIVMLTSLDDDGHIERICRGMGAVGFLRKPLVTTQVNAFRF